jgi:thiosulfate/3-mercaptopyruvate sulfurtransferase
MLIDSAWLCTHLRDANWILFDCRHDLMDHGRGARLYAESHIAGAHFASVETDLAGTKTGVSGRHPLPEPGAFAAFLNLHGVTPETQIVAYDDVGGQYAARLWWLARWLGHARVAVLDGGWQRWTAAGYPVDSTIPRALGGGTLGARPEPRLVRTADELRADLSLRRWLVIDARSPERYRGEAEPIDRVAGRIPGAANRFFKDNLKADTCFRPAAELRAEFERLLGGRPPAEIVHQCGSGITACANLLAMEHAGLTGSTLYAGSWSEWIADPSRPVATGA